LSAPLRLLGLVGAAPSSAAAPFDDNPNPVDLYIQHLSPGSRPAMKAALNVVARVISKGAVQDARLLRWGEVRYADCCAVRSYLMERYRPSSCNRHLSAVRQVLRTAFLTESMEAGDYLRAVQVEAVPGASARPGRLLGREELFVLLADCRAAGTAAALRDLALTAVGYGCGLRRAELCGLDLGDLEVEEGRLLVRRAKGGRERFAYLAPQTLAAILCWIEVRGAWPGPLFTAVSRSSSVLRHRLRGQSVAYILDRRRRQAGLRRFSPHDLRRSHISHLLDLGVDLATASAEVGHASVQQTGCYDRRSERATILAAGLLGPTISGESRHC
jgi:integrase